MGMDYPDYHISEGSYIYIWGYTYTLNQRAPVVYLVLGGFSRLLPRPRKRKESEYRNNHPSQLHLARRCQCQSVHGDERGRNVGR